MSNDCIFCQIVAKKAPATVVVSGERSLGIVPRNPVTEGHVIFLARKHVTDATVKMEQLRQQLAAAETELRAARQEAGYYDIALRPDNPDVPDRMDDIVVRNVAMFRAEQTDRTSWWVACIFADTDGLLGDELVFDVYARQKPARIDWMLRDKPAGDFIYEKQMEEH